MAEGCWRRLQHTQTSASVTHANVTQVGVMNVPAMPLLTLIHPQAAAQPTSQRWPQKGTHHFTSPAKTVTNNPNLTLAKTPFSILNITLPRKFANHLNLIPPKSLSSTLGRTLLFNNLRFTHSRTPSLTLSLSLTKTVFHTLSPTPLRTVSNTLRLVRLSRYFIQNCTRRMTFHRQKFHPQLLTSPLPLLSPIRTLLQSPIWLTSLLLMAYRLSPAPCQPCL